MNTIWHNGLYKEDGAALLPIDDRALRGVGVFDTMLVSDGQPVHTRQHIERLVRHARIFGLDIPYDLARAAHDMAAHQPQGRWALSTTVTGGPAARGLHPPDKPEPQIIMRLSPAPPEKGQISALIAQSVRRNEASPLSRIKSLNYGDHILALQEAKAAGADEALLLNTQGLVTCFTIGNLFILKDDALYTPPLSDGVMDGIMRGRIIEERGATEQSLSLEDLEQADALFLSNSLRGMVEVRLFTPP